MNVPFAVRLRGVLGTLLIGGAGEHHAEGEPPLLSHGAQIIFERKYSKRSSRRLGGNNTTGTERNALS